MIDVVRVHPDVAVALADGAPVVALETTLVSHGFPHGEGASVARACEERVRAAGGVPATIDVLDGSIRVGLDEVELELFADSPEARKAGARDLAACVAQRALGATTVGGTLAVARSVGIQFLGTGGLGGVHRGWSEHPDVSADLAELARTRALVVAAGAKSILDVPATAELLETLGVPVLGWHTSSVPLFYAADGGPPVSARVESPEEAARIADVHWRLGGNAVVLARPPDASLDVEPLIAEGVSEARAQGIAGQAVTPFLLAFLHERSGGRTVEANKRLVAENAALAGELAVAFTSLASGR
ncbi:MAG: pseudouridine-5'-phosphate glycosidase [Thermoleophilia bacterium]|nr:pseudouridine-5'-phosphate glycosidase [Thermoleophilia bacterium]